MRDSSQVVVLVVEDNDETRGVLTRILLLRGYEVLAADDGVDALSYLRAGSMPSVIVLDMRMPNMDGYAFQRALKADPRWADIPVIIFSAFPPDDPGDAIGVVRKGSADPDALLALVVRASEKTTPRRPGR